MQIRKPVLDNLFLVISGVAALFVLTELVLKSFGMSICSYEGCKMTAQYARFGDRSIFLIGFITFASLAGLAYLNRSLQNRTVNRIVNLVLVTALAGEGFFMGYLAFRIHTICLICVSIFGFIVALGVVRLLAGETGLLAGFGAAAAVFLLQYLVLPAGIPVDLPLQERMILFYSKECRHCAELMADLDRKKIKVVHLQATDYARFLKDMGIDAVPTLMVNNTYEKTFLTGKDAIEKYLDACNASPKKAAAPSGGRSGGSGRRKPADRKPRQEQEIPSDLFGQPGVLSIPVGTAAGEGMCRQDVECK